MHKVLGTERPSIADCPARPLILRKALTLEATPSGIQFSRLWWRARHRRHLRFRPTIETSPGDRFSFSRTEVRSSWSGAARDGYSGCRAMTAEDAASFKTLAEESPSAAEPPILMRRRTEARRAFQERRDPAFVVSAPYLSITDQLSTITARTLLSFTPRTYPMLTERRCDRCDHLTREGAEELPLLAQELGAAFANLSRMLRRVRFFVSLAVFEVSGRCGKRSRKNLAAELQLLFSKHAGTGNSFFHHRVERDRLPGRLDRPPTTTGKAPRLADPDLTANSAQSRSSSTTTSLSPPPRRRSPGSGCRRVCTP